MKTLAIWTFWLIALGLLLSSAAILLLPWLFVGFVGMSIYFYFEGAADSRRIEVEIKKYKESPHFCTRCGVQLSWPFTQLCETHHVEAKRYREVKQLAIEQLKQELLATEVNAEVERMRRTR